VKIRLGVDIACRAPHQASSADEHGVMLFTGHRFRTDPDELEALWARLPADAGEVTVVMEPTRNAWVALAAWFRRRGATVVMAPPEQSADLRAYYNKHAKTDRLDSRVLARLPLLHPEGLHREDALGPGDALKRAVKLRSGLVHRRTSSMARLDALLEILGPAWVSALGSDMSLTALRFLAPQSQRGVGGLDDRGGAPQIAGRLGDASRFANLAAVRSFAGLVPHQDASGMAARAGGPTKAGDACLREALFMAADHARRSDPACCPT
jgi:transposase